MLRRSLFVLLLVIAAASASSDDRISVFVFVNADDKDFADRLSSYISRELRDLRDVDQANDVFTAQYAIRILALKPQPSPDCSGVGAISWDFTTPSDRRGYPYMIDGGLEVMVTESNVRGIAERIVISFDTTALKRHREAAVRRQPSPQELP